MAGKTSPSSRSLINRLFQSPSAVLSIALLLLLPCCSVAVEAAAKSIFFNKCPQPSVVQSFDVNAYLGLWYENRNYFAIFQEGGRCVTATYTDQGNGIIGVDNSMINILNKPQSIEGQAKLADPSSTEGKLTVSFFSDDPLAASTITDANYQVLDTDYNTYAVVWSCRGIAWFFNKQSLWILTRERDPPASVVETALAAVNSRGLDASKLAITDQTNC